jgi:hypothetical protein
MTCVRYAADQSAILKAVDPGKLVPKIISTHNGHGLHYARILNCFTTNTIVYLTGERTNGVYFRLSSHEQKLVETHTHRPPP